MKLTAKERKLRRDIIKILDDEGAWVVVPLGYIFQCQGDGFTKYNKDGTPDRRLLRGRLLVKFVDALDRAVDLQPVITRREDP